MSTENLSNEKAKEKFESLVNDIKVCMMITNLSGRPLSAVPMSHKKVDDEGNIWFLTGNDSDHIFDIKKNSGCQLIFSDSKSKFLSVYGEAKIILDQKLVHEFYSGTDNAYFDGKDDPRLVTVKFIPEQAAYWSSQENRIVTLFKLGIAAITGKKQDLRNSGKMEL